ncbi:GNAT family N-acetyltransferase [Streptomyces sp. cg36]|uniref:GNAT family N-acetyltransferase n=1 Tax=Streptomyces sp. cg36 TaxID=3238798 RepID=UPI0034E1C757
MEHVIRPVRADEWLKAKELRLAALADPAAPVAFLETTEQAEAQPDSFWQDRTARATGTGACQFIAEAPDGTWAGSVVVLIEEPGTEDFFGARIEATQGHLVGVFVRPEHRGIGLTERLFAAAVEWAWSLEPALGRVRLYVHEDNPRARGFYGKFGFVPTGRTTGPSAEEGESSASQETASHEIEMELVRP